ncbi:Major Facilitator Superfamily protein [Planifilum fulgidum]|jgi:MFS family permease|uniref:Major Facilitator Superfamily protein n=1 Tax=Planifilum fulgidum TaxID=201973 RepID=A0A1I2KNY1_9BACL|nr:Major Facilitator Superfamily protein [Planifilum fulgidum]
MDITLQNLFRQPPFVMLWLSQTLQSLGTVLLQVIVMVNVYRHTDSVFSSSLVLAVMALGSFAGGILGSRYIHRFSPVQMLKWIEWSRAGLTVILGLFLYKIEPLLLFLTLAVLFVVAWMGAWYQPARFALLPMVVSKKEYMKANGTLNVVYQLFLVAGWGLGGMLVAAFPFYAVILIITLSFLLSGVCIRGIRLKESATLGKTSKPEPAWRKIFRAGVIRNLTLMDLFEALANVVWTSAFILAFTHEILGKGSEWWGFINASYWVGGIVGSFMVVLITGFLEKRVGYMIALSALSMSLLTFFFAVNSTAILALWLCLMMGPIYQIREICQETVLQDVLSPMERAKVMAARVALLTPWGALTHLIMGWLADRTDIQSAYLLGAVLYGITFLIAILHPQLKNYQYRTGEKSSASQSS